MNNKLDLKFIQALWILGLIPNEKLPEIGVTALENGYDCESLVRLSISSKDESEEIKKYFVKTLAQLGIKELSKLDALKLYTKHIANQILKSDLTPLDGAKKICEAKRKFGKEDYHDIDGFIYAESEAEDRPEDKDFFEKSIIEEAKNYLKTAYDGPVLIHKS